MWVFRSKSSPVSGDSPRGACKGYIFALEVAEELEQWPEQDTHGRRWVSNQPTHRRLDVSSLFIRHLLPIARASSEFEI